MNEKYKALLKKVSRILDSIEYECCAHQYTLSEDEMSKIFSCRDEIDWMFMNERE